VKAASVSASAEMGDAKPEPGKPAIVAGGKPGGGNSPSGSATTR
jgi:hypothetical protein